MQPKRLKIIGLGLITALLLLVFGNMDRLPFTSISGESAIAQQTTPTPTPTPTPEATPEATPEPAPPPEPTNSVEALPLSGSAFKDPQGRFEVGIIQDFNVGFAGNFPLFESPDGNLAYTVVARYRESDRTLPELAIAQIAIEIFERGEGFRPGNFETLGTGEVQMPWTGTLKIGARSQPMSGVIFARQAGNQILVLLVSATAAGAPNIEGAVAALSDTLQPL
ncbi:hypothetical protein POG23_18110 [Limnoraphis robusta]|nr:hypothetical protein [Limnoraphis robusta]